MIEILARHFESNPVTAPIEKWEGASRVKGMVELNRQVTRGGNLYRQKKLSRDVKTLQRLSQSYLPSRAIKLIRDGVCHTEWAIRAKNSENEEALASQIEIVTSVLDNPNPKDDDFGTFLGQIIEDLLIFDAGSFEYIVAPLWMERNPYLQLSVIPGYMMAENIKWDGDPDEDRWVQITPEGRVGESFLDSEIEYIMQRKRSWSAWGFSPMESAIELMESWLGLSNYQRNVGSNAYPRFMMYIGEGAEETQVEVFRSYWRNELLGQGLPGIWGGGTGKPEVLDLKPTGDDGLYLKYQEMLIRSFAYSFGLKAQDFNLERDVNRCHDEQTEVLTSDGWKYHDELNKEDLVAQVDPETHAISFIKPEKIHRYQHSGELVYFSNGLSDWAVTGNHRMWVEHYGTNPGEPEFIEAKELTSGRFREWKTVMPSSGSTPETFEIPRVEYGATGWNEDEMEFTVEADVLMRFLGWYISEGGMLKQGPRNIFTIAQKDIGNVEDIRDVLSRMPLRSHEYYSQDDGCFRWNCTGKSICTYLRKEAGVGSANVRIPGWVFELSIESRQTLFNTLMAGDGCWGKRPNETCGQYGTISQGLANDVQRLAFELGYRTSMGVRTKRAEHHSQAYVVMISRRGKSIFHADQIRLRPYEGIVWCVSVPTGLFVTRRNGKIAIHGNSQGEVSQSASVEEARKPPAMLIAKKINVRVIPAIANAVADERIKELEFYWIGLDPRDLEADAKIHHIYVDDNVLVLDEIRADLGHPPLPGRLGRMTKDALKELVKQNPYVFLDEEDIKEFAELEEIRREALGLDEEVLEIELEPGEPQPLLSAGEEAENEVYISFLNE